MSKRPPVLIRKLAQFAPLGEEERAAIVSLLATPRQVEGNTDLLLEGDAGNTVHIIDEGWAYCYKDLADGRRQIINFQLPGDFLGMRSLMLRTSDHCYSTFTACSVFDLRRAQIEELFARYPKIATAFLWTLARDEAMLFEHLLSLGRRSADERTAHLLCEIGSRATLRGLVEGAGFHCPVPQTLLADALGLSVVHLNRTLRKLRERGLVVVGNNGLDVPDLARLVRETGFDARYLGLGQDDDGGPDHRL